MAESAALQEKPAMSSSSQPRTPTPRSLAGRRLAAWALCLFGLTAGLATSAALATTALAGDPAPRRTVISYDSTLRDQENKAVSGLFAMTFELRKAKAKKSFWKEKHWVSVDNGQYRVQLGRQTNLPKDFDPKSVAIRISITGVGEVLNESLTGGDLSVTEESSGVSSSKKVVQYAEKAGFAYEAERATVADRLGNFTAKVLQDALDELRGRKLKVKVSKNYMNLPTIGGVGGTPFESICPAGHTMVGIRGGSGIYIDNFQVVCAPLE
jgi:hypothetical protein